MTVKAELLAKEVAPPHGELQNPKILLYAQDFDQHGMTAGCPKCKYFVKYGEWSGRGKPVHSVRCRERMTIEIAKSLEGQRRIAAASAKLDVTVEQLGNPLRSDLPLSLIHISEPTRPY